jgi:hypothetical protein
MIISSQLSSVVLQVRLENFIVRALSNTFISKSTINAFASLIVNSDIILIAFSKLLAILQAHSEKNLRLAAKSDKVQSTDLKHRPEAQAKLSPHCQSRANIRNLRAYRSTNPTTTTSTSIHYQIYFSHNAVLPRYETSVRPRSGDCPIRNPIEEGTM